MILFKQVLDQEKKQTHDLVLFTGLKNKGR